MPLYKITERRLKRKERDEASGLAGIKAALREADGGDGTDDDESESSESDSESENDSEGEDESDEDDDEEGGSADDDEVDDSDGSGLEDDLDDEEEAFPSDDEPIQESEEDEEEGTPGAGPPPMSITAAITSPIYTGPATKRLNRRVSMCVLCPGKEMHSDKIVDVHLASKLHKRSLTRYQARLAREPVLETEDPREIVRDIIQGLGSTVRQNNSKGKGKAAVADIGVSSVPHSAGQRLIKQDSVNAPGGDVNPVKRKKKSKAQRQEARARALLDRIQQLQQRGDGDHGAGPITATPGGSGGVTDGVPSVKLNRAAKRLLAKRRKQAGKQAGDGGSGAPLGSRVSAPANGEGRAAGAPAAVPAETSGAKAKRRRKA